MEGKKYREIKKVLWTILIANVFVAIIKIVLGGFMNSVSISADGFHSISDGASNVVGIIGITIASKPKDKEHPYGHRKYEVISSLFIGSMLLFMSVEIFKQSIDRFTNNITPNISLEYLLILLVTIIINIAVAKYEQNKGNTLKSHILISDSKHTRSDIYVSIGVLCTLLGIKLGLPSCVDIIMSIIVVGFILHASYEIFRESIDILVDKNAVDEELIREIVEEYNEIKGVHNIRSRGSKYDMYIDMHILINPDISVEQAHTLAHDIEDNISAKVTGQVQVIVHVEPYYL